MGEITERFYWEEDGHYETKGMENYFLLWHRNLQCTVIQCHSCVSFVIPSQGVLSLVTSTKKVILQGVNELYEMEPSTSWGDEPRINRLVFIGILHTVEI